MDRLKDKLHQDRGKSERGFIHEEQQGFCHETAANGQHLLLTPGKRPCVLIQAFFQSWEFLKDALQVLMDARPIRTQVGTHLQILSNGHSRQHASALWNLNDSHLHNGVWLPPIDLLALKKDTPLARFQCAGDGFQEGAFSRPIGPNQDHHFSLLHPDADILDGENPSVSRGDIFYCQHFHDLLLPR